MAKMAMNNEQDLQAIYRDHPLSARSILARVERDLGTGASIGPIDLAVDLRSEITDQNHFGGLEFTLKLGELLDLSRSHRVLDLGSGIGGSARVLALAYGCTVDAIELMPFRHEDALTLSDRTGQSKGLNFLCGDFLEADFPDAAFDRIIGQGSINHFADRTMVFRKCRSLLRGGGLVAVEEVCLRTSYLGDSSLELDELADLWQVHWEGAEDWNRRINDSGFEISSIDDLDRDGCSHLLRLTEAAQRSPEFEFTATELRSWQLGYELMSSGVLGFRRIIARAI